MSLSLHTLKPARGSAHRRKRLGRGNASGHGTYSTRGIKGQRARQGGRKGLVQLGVKHFIARLPKVRGFRGLKPRPQVITVGELGIFDDGSKVTLALFKQRGLAHDRRRPVKIIAGGALKRKLNVQVHIVSAGARSAIESAGGTVELVPFVGSKTGIVQPK